MVKIIKILQIILKKIFVIHESIFNRNIFHIIVLIGLLFAVHKYVINIDIYNNACLVNSEWYCRFDSRILLFIPEFFIYSAMFFAINAMTILYATKKNVVYPLSPLPIILFFFVFFRFLTLGEYDNKILLLGYEYYALIGEYFRNILVGIMAFLLLFTKQDFFEIKEVLSIASNKEVVKKEIVKTQETNAEVDTYEIQIVRSIKSALPGILSRILAGNQFKKITYDSEGNFKSSMLTIKSVDFEKDSEVFVELSVHIDLIDAIKDLSNYDWTLGINSNGKIEKFLSAKWRSIDGRNGILIQVRENSIDMKDTFDYPFLLEKNPLIKHPMDLMVGTTKLGEKHIFNLAKMPHLLVGGATGMGKTVAITNIIVSLLKNIIQFGSESLRVVIVDPKILDTNMYKGISGVMVINDYYKALNMLKHFVAEMNRRYDVIAATGKNYKNIETYNKYEDNKLNYEVIIIDEIADIMMGASDIKKEFETCVALIGQKARAAGIHLILGTQRPDKNVVTGIIKANIPGILGFGTINGVNSGIIIGTPALAKLSVPGQCILKSSGQLQNMKSYYIEDKDLEKFLAYYNSELLKQKLKNTDTQKAYENITIDNELPMSMTDIMEAVVINSSKSNGVVSQLEIFDSPIVLWGKYLSSLKNDDDFDPMDPILRITGIIVQQNGYSNREAFRQLGAQLGFSARGMDNLGRILKDHSYLIYNEKLKSNILNINLSLEEIDNLYNKIKETLGKTMS